MSATLESKYDTFYSRRAQRHVYPVEFVVRAYLGDYPRLARRQRELSGRRGLDLGCGDGRNMPLLFNLGLQVFGTEISESICELTRRRMQALGIDAELCVGRNHAVPFPDAHFDELLACHACYYVEPGTTFADNVREFARVVAPRGRFVFSAPMDSTYILRGAQHLGDGHWQVAHDPYGLRNGSVLKAFQDVQDIERCLAPYFGDLAIGSCRNDFWGIEEHVWTAVGFRTSVAVS